MLEIAYGRTIADHDESFIAMASNAILQLTEAGSPSASLADFIPIRQSPQYMLLHGRKLTVTVGPHSALHAYLAPGQRMEAQGARSAEVDAGGNDPPVREDKAGRGTCYTPRILHLMSRQCNAKVDGTAGPSLLTTLFEETEEGCRRTTEDERAMKGIASVLYAGEKV